MAELLAKLAASCWWGLVRRAVGRRVSRFSTDRRCPYLPPLAVRFQQQARDLTDTNVPSAIACRARACRSGRQHRFSMQRVCSLLELRGLCRGSTMPSQSCLPEKELRRRARKEIQTGRLPESDASAMWGGHGSGLPCAVCRETITSDQVEYEIPDPRDGCNSFRFHTQCHMVWQIECVGDRPATTR